MLGTIVRCHRSHPIQLWDKTWQILRNRRTTKKNLLRPLAFVHSTSLLAVMVAHPPPSNAYPQTWECTGVRSSEDPGGLPNPSPVWRASLLICFIEYGTWSISFSGSAIAKWSHLGERANPLNSIWRQELWTRWGEEEDSASCYFK